MQDTWFWVSGDAMRFTKWPLDITPHMFSQPCAGVARGEHFEWVDKPCDGHFNFLCQSGRGGGCYGVTALLRYLLHIASHFAAFTFALLCPAGADWGSERVYYASRPK